MNKIFGVLDDCPKEHCRYYLKKIFAEKSWSYKYINGSRKANDC